MKIKVLHNLDLFMISFGKKPSSKNNIVNTMNIITSYHENNLYRIQIILLILYY